ncbi:MAG: hypothetical protein AMS21_12720 [Gemmatimonas sp. SG8_38_2]|nr:MAG: hypothetical protein AMS21_12720 [Gemmatimonas sp. SG8_38_2]
MYSLRLFGGTSLEGPSGPLTGRVVQHRQFAVLALLAAARGTGCSRDKLVGYLWPESEEERARHLLSDSLYHLRRSLGEDSLVTSREYVRLNTEVVECDLIAFLEALEREDPESAVALYCGPFLDGFYAEGSLEFAHWVESERQKLADQYADAIESLAVRAEEAGDFLGSSNWWRRLARHDPYNSRAVLRLMQALAAAGDRGNALQLAQEHVEFLTEELELEPPPELLALVERLKHETAEADVAGRTPGLEVPTPRPIADDRIRAVSSPSARRARPKGKRTLALAASLTLVAVLLIALGRALSPSGSAERVSIAVLPFENLTGNPESDYLAAGFHEEVISQLAKLGDVRVIARTSVLRYRDNPTDLRTVAEELDVDHVLEASIRAEGERMRITVQLIDPVRNDHVWTENYDHAARAMLDVQLDVARQVAERLRAEITPGERARIEARPTESQEAYDYYLRGLTFESNYEFVKAEQMYSRAVAIDSTFALALARLGYISAHLYFVRGDYRFEERLTRAKEAIDRALELDPDLFEAHISEHYYYFAAFRDYETAFESLERARALRPSDAEVYRRLGLMTRRMGRFEEAMEYLLQALELSPRYRSLLINAATTAIWMRDFPAAESFLDRGLDVSPDDSGVLQWQALLYVNWGDTTRAGQAYGEYLEVANRTVPEATTTFWRAVWRTLHENFRPVLRQHTLTTFGGDSLSYYYLKALSYLTTGERDLFRAYCDSGRVVEEVRLQALAPSKRLPADLLRRPGANGRGERARDGRATDRPRLP